MHEPFVELALLLLIAAFAGAVSVKLRQPVLIAYIVAAHGPAVARILEHAEERDADLIVLGKHGAGMVEELLLGSVTKHVLADARQDVLIAQPH